MATNAIDQTRRMLSLVTYLRERPGARVGDVARAFGITEDELIADLDVLPMCGTSFRGGDLLDIDTDGDRIWWHNPDDVAEPLRLAADEATALLVAARAVATLPGLREGDRQALLRATAKLEAAAGEAAGASSRLSVTFESEGGVFADVDRAIAERRRLWLRYYSPARDELTEREVDPIRLFAVGHTYVEAWCRLSEARRTFRLDRVAEIKLLDAPADPPPVELRDLSEGLVQPAAEDPEVSIEVGPGGRWVAEYYPHDSAEERPAHHPAHPRPGLAAAAGPAAGPGRPDRGAAGPRRQRAAGRRAGPRGVRRVSAAGRARRAARGEGRGSEG
jgi:proteasome accessory factor C